MARWWRETLIVRFSRYWDPDWYLAHNPDVAESSQKPLRHYVRYGAAEHRSPGPQFDAYGYWLLNPTSDQHPLLHYLRRPHQRCAPLECVDPDHPLLSSGWFDTEWYQSHRSAFIAAGTHPYVDYVQFGEAAGISPSPLLSTSTLRHMVPANNEYPCQLANIVAHGAINAQRPFIDVVESSADGQVIVPRAGRPMVGQGSVLVVVHAYYPDVLPEVLSHVGNVPADSTIVIVVPDAARVDEVERVAAEVLGPGVTYQIVISDNRGRNFGPLVSDLVPLIREHDYLLHLHTKKSVYSGAEQDQWRHHLYRTLAGSGGLVETILGVLDDETQVGVIYPSTFDGVPHWAHHWLSNVGVGRELYRRIGLDPLLVSGIVDYPVGGMFWARTTALKRLWDAGFRLEDFPAEPLGNDGTLAHAIERSILDIARSDGFDVVEIDMTNRMWRKNWSGRQHLPTRPDSVDQITRALPESDLVTVDLFDTLVLRPSLNPSTLQRLAAARVAEQFGIDPEKLLQRRLEAESNARTVVAGDVQVDDICAAAPVGHREAVAAMIAAEVDLEADVCIPRPWLIDLLRKSKRPEQPMVLMSDTYLPRSCIDDLIDKIRCRDLFDDVLVSNEVRARKDTGAMWDLVEERYGVARNRWLHLGDNEHSDVQVPRDRGINALHVPSPSGVANYRGVDRRHVDQQCQLGTDLVVGLAATALYGDGHRWWDEASAARRFGWAGIGPMLWTYVTWLIQHPETRSADRILFIARDGYLSYRLLERLRPLLSADVPPSAYFLTSRCCALSIAQAGGPRWDLLLGLNTYKGPLRDLVRHRLGFELPNDPRLDQEVVLPAEVDAAQALLEPYVEQLVEQGHRDLVAFKEYVHSLGVGPEERIVLSDLGYSGTIQRCLEGVLPQTFAGLYAATTSLANRTTGVAHGAFSDGVVLQHEDTVMGNGLLLEAVWAADHGQVIRFESSPDGPVPRFREPDVTDEAHQRELREIQDAAIDFCMEVIDRFGPEIIDQPVDTHLALKPFADLIFGEFTWANDVLEHYEVEGDFVGTGPSRVRKNYG